MTEFNNIYQNYKLWVEAEIDSTWIQVPEYVADITFENSVLQNFKPYFKEHVSTISFNVEKGRSNAKLLEYALPGIEDVNVDDEVKVTIDNLTPFMSYDSEANKLIVN